MEKQKKIIILLEFLLIFFVLLLVVRLVLVNKQINQNNDYLNSDDELINLDEPLILASDPWLGSKNSKINIVVFESFNCPYCRELQPILKYALNNYSNKVKLVWKDFTGSYDQRGLRAAVAARCAQAQGKFWEFHDYIFTNQDNLSDTLYLEIAQTLNLDLTKFNQCFQNQETLSLVSNSFTEARALDVEVTPTMYINKEKVEGLLSQEELDYIINQF